MTTFQSVSIRTQTLYRRYSTLIALIGLFELVTTAIYSISLGEFSPLANTRLIAAGMFILGSLLTWQIARNGRPVEATFTLILIIIAATTLIGVIAPEVIVHATLLFAIGGLALSQSQPNWRLLVVSIAAYLLGLALISGLPGNFNLPQWALSELWIGRQIIPTWTIWVIRIISLLLLAILSIQSYRESQARGEALPLGYALSTGITLIVAISLLTVVAVFVNRLQGELSQQVGQQFLGDARREGDNQLQQFQESLDRLRALGRAPEIVPGVILYNDDPNRGEVLTIEQSRLIDAVLQFEAENPIFSNIIVADDRRNQVYTTITGEVVAPVDPGSIGWWTIAYNEGQGGTYFGPIHKQDSGRVFFDVAVPIQRVDNGQIIGAMRATVEPAFIPLLDTLAAERKIIKVVSLEDDTLRGVVINSSEPAEVGELIQPGVIDDVIAEPLGWGIDPFDDGRLYIHSHAVLRETSDHPRAADLQWVILLEQPQSIATLPVTTSIRVAVTAAMLVLAVTTGLAAIFTDLVVRPINRFIDVTTAMAAGKLNLKAPSTGSQEFQRLARSFNHLTQQLADQVALLQVRVQERTRYLLASQEVARTASALFDSDELNDRIVNLIADRFGFYYVSIFLVDEYQEYAILKAATGEVGKTLLQQGHKVEIDESSQIGRTIIHSETQFEKIDSTVPMYFESAALSNSQVHAEMTLPLQVGNTVLGVLDIQTVEGATFDFDDQNTVAVLETTADQLAVVINNAQSFARQTQLAEENQRLLGETERNVDKLQRLTQQLSTEGWESFFQRNESEIMVEDMEDIELGAQLVATRQALSLDQAVASQSLVQTDGEVAELAVPIKIRDTVIGALALGDDDNTSANWSEDEIAIISEVAEHIALAVDNARLLDETHVRLAEQNWLYQVAKTASAATTLDEALDETVQLIHQRMQDAVISILLLDEERQALTRHACAGYPGDASLEVGIGEGIIGHVAQTGQPLRISNVRTSNLYIPAHTLVSGAALALPLNLGDEIVGIIYCESATSGLFTESDQNLLTTLASTLAAVVVNAQLLTNEQEQRRLATTLKEVAGKMSETLNETQLRNMIIGEIYDYLNPDEIILYEWIAADDTLQVAQRLPAANEPFDAEANRIKLNERVDLWDVFASELPLIESTTTDEDNLVEHYRFPWHVGEMTTGVIEVYHTATPGGRMLGPTEQQFCEGIVRQAANAIQLARVYEEQRQTAERLAELDRLKSQFLANMSHELRTPLNSIIGFSRVILKGIDGPVTDLQEQDLSAIYNAGQHLLQLINDVLDLSKIEAGKMELAFEDVDLAEMIDDVLNSTIRALVKDKSVELRQNTEPDLPLVYADRIRIRQVLINIIGNASKFTDEGYIEVRARHIIEDDQPMVEVAVHDTGTGISKEGMQKLFKSFSQVDSSPTRATGGSGLGLSLCKYMVEMHGGRIWVESEIGVGSTFKFTVPIIPQDDEFSSAEDTDNHLIIAVDNDPGLFEVYERYLRDANFELVGLTDGNLVLDEVIAQQPRVVLLEVELESTDGWELLEQLTTHTDTKHIAVIVVSVHADQARALDLGAKSCLVKPILEADLTHALKSLTRTIRAREVLLIDDRPEDIRLIKEALSQTASLNIREAVGGLAGITAIRSNPPQAIIVDLIMPEIDGYSIIEAVRSNPQTRHIPILVVTGAELSQNDLARLERYGTDYWVKDIFRNEDKQAVSKMLEALEKMI